MLKLTCWAFPSPRTTRKEIQREWHALVGKMYRAFANRHAKGKWIKVQNEAHMSYVSAACDTKTLLVLCVLFQLLLVQSPALRNFQKSVPYKMVLPLAVLTTPARPHTPVTQPHTEVLEEVVEE